MKRKLLDLSADVPIVFLAGVELENCLSGRTRQLAEAISQRNVEVIYVEMLAKRTKVRRLVSRILGETSPAETLKIRVVRVPPLPRPRHLIETWYGRFEAKRIALRLLQLFPQLPSSRVVVSNPLWVPVLRFLRYRQLCYDYIDHVRVHAHPHYKQIYDAWENELISMSHIISYVNPRLCENLDGPTRDKPMKFIPNGVRRDWADDSLKMIDVPQQKGDKPVAGFLGAIFQWVDLELLEAVARLVTEVLFVLIGPSLRSTQTTSLEKLSNVQRLGAQRFCDVPRWLHSFNAGLIPFKKDGVSEYCDPLKLYEYAACGIPVVSSLELSHVQGKPRIYYADLPETFVETVREAVGERSKEHRLDRIRFALENTWDHRAEAMLTLMRESG